MNKNPVLVLTGLAVGAVAVVAGLTKDKWMDGAPQVISDLATTAAPEKEPVAEAPTAAPAKKQAPAEAPAHQAAAPAEAPPPAAVQPVEQQAAAPAETPAPAVEQTAEQSVAPAEPQAAAIEKPAEQPAEPPAEQPVEQAAAPAEPQAPAAVQPAEPQIAAVELPAVEPPAKTSAETTVGQAPEPAPDQASGPAGQRIPTFDTVRVEKTGEAVIAGTAEAGAEVVVKLDGAEIGKTIANHDGAFVVVPDNPLPEGSGALTIEARTKGAAAAASEQVVAIIVPAKASRQDALVAVVSPGAPTRVLQSPQPGAEPEPQVAAVQPETATPPAAEAPKPTGGKIQQLSLDAVDYDETGNIVFTGRAEPGHGARIYVDNGHLGDAITGGDGRWAFSGTADIAIGVHTLRIDGIDSAGKVLNRIEVPFYREESRKVASAAEAPAEPDAKTDLEPAEQAAVVAGPEAQDPAQPKKGRVVIQPGNNLWRIAKVLYGDGRKYTMLYEANKDQIRNPDRIYPGQIFATPNVVPPEETIDPDRRDPMTAEETVPDAQ